MLFFFVLSSLPLSFSCLSVSLCLSLPLSYLSLSLPVCSDQKSSEIVRLWLYDVFFLWVLSLLLLLLLVCDVFTRTLLEVGGVRVLSICRLFS